MFKRKNRNTINLLLLLPVFMFVLSGCIQQGPDFPQASKDAESSEESVPIIIGEDPPKQETTDLVVIDETGGVQEKELKDSTESGDSYEPAAIILEDWTWEKDSNFTYVNGSLENTGDIPIGFFRIRAEYVDSDGNIVDTNLAVHGEVVWPGHQKRFKISKSFAENHKSVRIWLDQLSKAKEPIIKKGHNQNAEIVNGWTWTTDGPFSYIEGTIKNTGTEDIRYYKIMAEYSNAEGQVLDSEFTNSNARLKPGAESTFEIMHPYAIEFQEVTIYISVLD